MALMNKKVPVENGYYVVMEVLHIPIRATIKSFYLEAARSSQLLE